MFKGCHSSKDPNPKHSTMLAAREAIHEAKAQGFTSMIILTKDKQVSEIIAGKPTGELERFNTIGRHETMELCRLIHNKFFG